jgi:hypothetical protein
MARPWNVVEDSIKGKLSGMADATKGAIVATPAANLPAAPPGAYAVGAQIHQPLNTVISTGQYTQQSGIHAEIDAINRLPPGWLASPAAQNAILLSSDNPCKRCAAILRAFISQYNWTVRSLAQAFHSNYAGNYNLPDSALNPVILQLVNNHGIDQQEAVHYREKIRSLIQSWG